MPDVTLLYPDTMFRFGVIGFESEFARTDMMESVASIVAKHFDCDDYDGNPLSMEAKKINLLMVPYSSGYAHMHEAPVRLTITGYDYPSRMFNRKQRLQAICEELSYDLAALNINNSFVSRLDHEPIDNRLVSVQFIPIPDDCFV